MGVDGDDSPPDPVMCTESALDLESISIDLSALDLQFKLQIEPKREDIITLDEALTRVGGFGRFQVFSCMVFAVLRNFGQLPVYIFGINSEVPELYCRHSSYDAYEICTTYYVCSKRSEPNFEFRPNLNKAGFVNNWVIRNDWMCLS